MVEYSVVIPAYNEVESVEPLYRQLTPVMANLGKPYEIVFIDDGSTDGTYAKLQSLHEQDPRVKVIKFRKNFGQTAGWAAGFDYASGNIIIGLDSDLQNDPADIPKLLQKLDEGYDAVSGWRKYRKDPFLKKWISKIGNNWLRKVVTGEKVHDQGCSLKVYRREAAKDVELYGEMHNYVTALLTWKGFKVGEVVVNHRPRQYGQTKYKMTKVVKRFLDLLVVSFWMKYSARPIHLFGGLGVSLSAAGFILGGYLLIAWKFFGFSLANRSTPLLAVLMVVLGVQFVVSGLLADVMVKTYYGDGKRKSYSVDKTLGSHKGS